MKKTKNKYQSYLLLVLFALSFTSCEDWLTLYPQDRVVEENFWEDKNDLLGVRYAAYQSMQNTLEKFILWGDLRGDSYSLNPSKKSQGGAYITYKEIMEGLPDSSMSQFDWGGVYTTINYCNKVLNHGEEVLSKDKQFTNTEWKQIKAELTTLRALNYFYLIRAFKDVPYVNTLVNSDAEVSSYPTTNQLEILSNLIKDVEAVKGQARNRFSSIKDTKGLITNSAIYSLLADMYLWRAALKEGRGIADFDDDNRKCIEYCELAMNALANQNALNDANSGSLGMGEEVDEYGLIKNDFTDEENPIVNSYEIIFDENGNSRESIFELQYLETDYKKNSHVNSLWGNGEETFLAVSQSAIKKIYNDADAEFKADSRTWYSCMREVKATLNSATEASALPYMYKYVKANIMMKEDNTKTPYLLAPSTQEYCNWIFYRLTDVMLMKAEAHACLDEATETKKLVNAIHKRSYNTTDSKKGNAPANDDLIKFVMNQRQIELLGEGKRWFDLVRYAERIGGGKDNDPREKGYMNGSDGVDAIVDQFLINTYSRLGSALKNRIKNRWGLYNPIYYMELKASNGVLSQNPNWTREKYAN